MLDFPPDRFVDLLRHGKPQDGDCFRGSHNDALSTLGQTQMRQAIGNKKPWDCIISSPALRCAEFAQTLAAQLKLPLQIEANFREREFGDWEGLNAKAIDPEALKQFWLNPHSYTPPNAESMDDFLLRVNQQWQQVKAAKQQHTLLITHGGVIRGIIGEVLGIKAQQLILLEVAYASYSQLRLAAPPGLASLISHGNAQ